MTLERRVVPSQAGTHTHTLTPTCSRDIACFWSFHWREKELEQSSLHRTVTFRRSSCREEGVLDGQGSDKWGDVGAKKQGRSCKALNMWVWRRHDEKDGGKGGHMGTAAIAALPQAPVLTAQLDATGRKGIVRKPLPRARFFPGISSWTAKMLGYCGWEVTVLGAGNFHIYPYPRPIPLR